MIREYKLEMAVDKARYLATRQRLVKMEILSKNASATKIDTFDTTGTVYSKQDLQKSCITTKRIIN